MHDDRFATLPTPPYYAVIFSSRRRGGDGDGYAEAAAHMGTLVREQPGFLGAESTRDGDGFGITVAYFDSEDAIRAWRDHGEHAQTRTNTRGGTRSLVRRLRGAGGESGTGLRLGAQRCMTPL